MTLKRLHINNVRNLQTIQLNGLAGVNVFHGPNGSGKSSVLEAVHILGVARSFRSGSIKSLITHGREACTVHGVVVSTEGSLTPMGVRRGVVGPATIKVAGSIARTVAELVEHLPIQVINSDGFDLLTGSPETRRHFLNWGVFHVEHRFYPEWQRFQRGIKQRNILLRRGSIRTPELAAWTRELEISGSLIDKFRSDYLERLSPVFNRFMARLMPELADTLELRYRRGWDRALGYAEALESSKKSDFEQGYTHVGPQRADLKVVIDGHVAADTLSRGQQKLVVCGLKLAQGLILSRDGKKSCTFLVDDLPSELDADHAGRVCEVLSELEAQVFITAVEANDISRVWPSGEPLKMFHVEHGLVREEAEATKA